MSSYNNLLKVFRESILEEAGIKEDTRSDEFAFKSWLFDHKNSIVSYENGVLDLGFNNFVLEEGNIEYLPKDLKSIAAFKVIFRNCNIKEIKDITFCTWMINIEECNNLASVDFSMGNLLQDAMYKSGQHKLVEIINCNSLESASIKLNTEASYFDNPKLTEISMFDNKKLTNLSNIHCDYMNITHTNVTDLSQDISCKVLAVEDNKQINIPFECERTDMKDKYNQPLSSYFYYDYPKIKKEKNRVFYNDLKGKSEEDIFSAICKKQRLTVTNNSIEGNLEIRNDLLKEFPRNITNVNGILTIKDCSWLNLPEDLIVDELIIENCPNLKQLPKGLNTKNLSIKNTPIESLNELYDFTFIILDNVNMSSLPNNLEAHEIELKNCKNLHIIPTTIKFDNLAIDNVSLEELPNLNKQYKVTNIDFSKFKTIPHNCILGGINCFNINKTDTKLKSKIDNIKINNNEIISINNFIQCDRLEISNCNNLETISSDSIVVNKEFILSNCLKLNKINSKITSSHQSNIVISNCPILKKCQCLESDYPYISQKLKQMLDRIYTNIHPELTWNDVVIENTPIIELPVFECKNLRISNTNITTLPENLFVIDTLDICDADIQELPKSLNLCHKIKGFQGNKSKYPDFNFYEEPFSAEDDI